MTSAVAFYIANGGRSYLTSAAFEQRRIALAAKLKAGPVSFGTMAATLGLPVPIVVELFNSWQAEKAAAIAVKH